MKAQQLLKEIVELSKKNYNHKVMDNLSKAWLSSFLNNQLSLDDLENELKILKKKENEIENYFEI